VIVIQSFNLNDMHDEVTAELEKNFTEEPWECAQWSRGKKQFSDYRVLFRNSFQP